MFFTFPVDARAKPHFTPRLSGFFDYSFGELHLGKVFLQHVKETCFAFEK
jgi:hypothetical protein